MTQKILTYYTFHYWGAFCRGAFVRGLKLKKKPNNHDYFTLYIHIT
jgi:hypothetical protein